MAANAGLLKLWYLRRRKQRIYLYWCKNQGAKKRTRKVWVRNLYKERDQKGEYNLLVKELKLYDHELFFRYFRMLPGTFEVLLRLVVKYISKTTTRLRKPISPDQRLAVTLRYLVTGDSHGTIGLSYRMSPTTVGRIVFEACVTIWKTLLEQNYLKIPFDDDWMRISAEFEHYWNFPNVVGAIDGKHVQMFAHQMRGLSIITTKRPTALYCLGFAMQGTNILLLTSVIQAARVMAVFTPTASLGMRLKIICFPSPKTKNFQILQRFCHLFLLATMHLV